MRNEFSADTDSIGDWGGNEEEALACWNRYVAPALAELAATDDGDVYHTADLAWQQFCEIDGESWAQLGQRVAAFVRA